MKNAAQCELGGIPAEASLRSAIRRITCLLLEPMLLAPGSKLPVRCRPWWSCASCDAFSWPVRSMLAPMRLEPGSMRLVRWLVRKRLGLGRMRRLRTGWRSGWRLLFS